MASIGQVQKTMTLLRFILFLAGLLSLWLALVHYHREVEYLESLALFVIAMLALLHGALLRRFTKRQVRAIDYLYYGCALGGKRD